MRIAIVINTSWNIFNFRMNLAKALMRAGHEVVAIAPPDAYSERLKEAGMQYVPVHMENKGTNPVKDLFLIRQFYQIYKAAKPDVILQYTIKPNIYGTLAAKLAGIPVINNVSGLGTVFIVKNLVSKVALGLYKFAFQFPAKVFFQNRDDQELFLEHKLVKREITDVLPGSGVDTERFLPAADPVRNPDFRFLMIARVLFEKGIVEYVEAAKELKKRYPEARFQLLGSFDEAGNIGIKRTDFEDWIKGGEIEYLGTSDEVASVITQSDCVVLPSYREGTPKTLLEAAAMGKPIVTTDVPGCKETVVDSENGFLCEVRSAADLAQKMEKVLKLSEAEHSDMGKASRQLALTKFDEKHVIDRYLQTINEITSLKH
jgi:glycosyltransferase involved in cell wall biosynthesis